VPSHQHLIRALLVGASAVAVTIAALLLVAIAQTGRILPGTAVVGVDVGGRDVPSAQRLIAPALERETGRPIAVSAPGQRILLRPRDAGLTLDARATADAAFARGRTGDIAAAVARLTAPLRSVDVAPLHSVDVAPRGSVDEQRLQAWVAETADRIERGPSVGEVSIDPSTLAVRSHGPSGGVVVDRAASADRLRVALLDPHVDRVELVTSLTTPPSTFADIEEVASRIAQALEGPLVLHHEERRLSVDPQVLAGLITVAGTTVDGALRPTILVPADRVRAALGTVGRATFDRPAVDARFLTERAPSVELRDLSSVTFRPVPTDVPIVPGASFVAFDATRTAAQVAELVTTGRRVAPADVFERDPMLTTASALEGRPTHLLGTFTTAHPAGTARTINIRLLADLLDDRLIAPGEEFSVNGTSGPRRCEDGFVPAGTIIRGELVDTCGGGVSQFGTTILNAAYFAGLPLEQWQPHSFFISRYPAGREATLNYPELDVRFLNDTAGWLVLRTAHTPDSITVSLYGVPTWESVRADHGEPRDPTTFSEVIRVAPDLRPGARRVIQSGGNGFTVTVSRTRTPLDAAMERSVERWTTVYLPQQRIVEVGPTAPAAPSPPPAPTD
jgi:vancomycin resistance protein YoaR